MKNFIYSILTAEQQYENLISKGLRIKKTKEEVIFFLQHHSYFKLMLYFRPYRFEQTDNTRLFTPGTTRNNILEDYNFDREIRTLLFSHIVYIENSFKNTLCQITCQKLGNIRRSEEKNFVKQGDCSKVFIESVQPILNGINNGYSRHEHVKKYMKRYTSPQYPPFWNMIEVFTFGQIVKIYKYLNDIEVKKELAKKYKLNKSKLESAMKTIVDTRNICCHHNKLFDKTNWKIAKINSIDYLLGSRRDTIYHVCCVMKHLLQQIKNDKKFMNDLDCLIKKYPNVNTTFPTDRKTLRNS